MERAESANYDLLYELARDQLTVQFSFADTLDSKLGGTVGISTALLGILAAVLALRPSDLHDGPSIVLALLVGGCFVVTLLCSVQLLDVSHWKLGPKLEPGKIRRFLGDANESRRVAARALIESYCKNEKPYKEKLDRLKIAVAALILQAALLLALSIHGATL
jgi:hypothetical protein